MIEQSLLQALEGWIDGVRERGNFVPPGVLATGLVVVEHLRDGLPLSSQRLSSGSQIRRQSGALVESILAKHGEHRRFLSEGGRTSRANHLRGLELGEALNEVMPVGELPAGRLDAAADLLQVHLVQLIRAEYFDQERLVPRWSPDLTIGAVITVLVADARKRPGTAAGAVAQHLVGATLARHFSHLVFDAHGYTTGDLQTSRPGDFQLGDTVVHVTISPSDALFSRRCKNNLESGFRPLVIVPANLQVAALQLAANSGMSDQVSIVSLEQFVEFSVSVWARYDRRMSEHYLRLVFQDYNTRVADAEADPSLLLNLE